MDEREFDPNVFVFILMSAYLCLTRRSRNILPILMELLNSQRPIIYNAVSNNSMVNSILSYDDAMTRRHLRISSKTFIGIAKFLPNKNHGWGPEMELLLFLLWLACGTSYRLIGAAMDIPRSTICDIVHKLLDFTVDQIMPRVIKLPTVHELDSIGRKFNQRARTTVFTKAAGAIDGTHIEIICPVKLHDQYINRKLKYSIQCQAISDSSHKFIDVFIGFPGSVHDSRVLYNSPVFKEKQYPPQGFFLLRDSGYPCRMEPIALITPYKESNLNDTKKKFNKVFSSARNIVEFAFGKLKIRWRSIFPRSLQLKIENIVKTITVCFTFHNICMANNDDINFLQEVVDLQTTNEPIEDEIAIASNGDQQNRVQFREELFNIYINTQ